MATLNKIQIPDRLYFRIGDVADLLGVKPYVLRYWESEFPMINPQKSASGQRVYRRSDVETVLMIKHLLYEERYSVEGAKRRIKELRREGELKTFKEEAVAAVVVPEGIEGGLSLDGISQSSETMQEDEMVSSVSRLVHENPTEPFLVSEPVLEGAMGEINPSAERIEANPRKTQEILQAAEELKELVRKPIQELFSY